MKYIFLALGLAIGNFVYAALFGGSGYGAAFERSFFQAIAVLGAYLI